MSCEDRRDFKVFSTRPLWADPRVKVQAVDGLTERDGVTPANPFRLFVELGDGTSFFIPADKFRDFVLGVEDSRGKIHHQMSAGKDIIGVKTHNEWVITAKTHHKDQERRCPGHSHQICLGRAGVVEALAKLREAEEEYWRMWGDEGKGSGSPLPVSADFVLLDIALHHIGALGGSGETVPEFDRDQFLRDLGEPEEPESSAEDESPGHGDESEPENDDESRPDEGEEEALRADLIRKGRIRPAKFTNQTDPTDQTDDSVVTDGKDG